MSFCFVLLIGSSFFGVRRFYPDDPLWKDTDDLDIAPLEVWGLLKDYDFLENSFDDARN